jgi:hypothetical protein
MINVSILNSPENIGIILCIIIACVIIMMYSIDKRLGSIERTLRTPTSAKQSKNNNGNSDEAKNG